MRGFPEEEGAGEGVEGEDGAPPNEGVEGGEDGAAVVDAAGGEGGEDGAAVVDAVGGAEDDVGDLGVVEEEAGARRRRGG